MSQPDTKSELTPSDGHPQTDRELIDACLEGQSACFNELVLRYQHRLYQVIFRIMQSHEEAQDVVQEGFVMAYRKLNQFQGDAHFYPWLFRVTYNIAMNHFRKKTVSAVSLNQSSEGSSWDVPESHTSTQPDHQSQLQEKQQIVWNALNEIPHEFREVLILKEMEGLKYEQISSIIEIPIGTVRSRIHRGRMLLKDKLTRYLTADSTLKSTSS